MWHAVIGGIQQRVAGDIALLFQDLTDFFSDVVTAMIEHVRDVLHQDCQRLKCLDIPQIFQIQPRPRIMLEGLWMGVDFPQLRPADPGKGLARRAAYQHINGRGDRAETEFSGQLFRRQRGNVARDGMALVAGMEIAAMRSRRFRVDLHCCRQIETGRLESKRQPATAGEKVEHTRASASSKPSDFMAYLGGVFHRSFRPSPDASNSSRCGLKCSSSRCSRINRAIRVDFLNPRSRQ